MLKVRSSRLGLPFWSGSALLLSLRVALTSVPVLAAQVWHVTHAQTKAKVATWSGVGGPVGKSLAKNKTVLQNLAIPSSAQNLALQLRICTSLFVCSHVGRFACTLVKTLFD